MIMPQEILNQFLCSQLLSLHMCLLTVSVVTELCGSVIAFLCVAQPKWYLNVRHKVYKGFQSKGIFDVIKGTLCR